MKETKTKLHGTLQVIKAPHRLLSMRLVLSHTDNQITMPFSHHSHSGQFCAHAQNTLEEMVQAAIARKMKVFALTEHMPREEQDLYTEEVTLNFVK